MRTKMENLKKWMVGLDLTDHDFQLISYTYHLSKKFKPEEVVFVHIKRRENIPENFRVKLEYTREELLEMVENRVYDSFPRRAEIQCEVHEGTPYFDLWRETHIHQTDLFIAGEKPVDYGRKIVPEKFIRKSFCSVLFVPTEARKPKHIWVPIDFTKNSQDALKVALQFGSEMKITCHYVFETPSIDQVPDVKRKEYIAYYKQKHKDEMKEFIKQLPNATHVESHLTHWIYSSAADHIKSESEDHDVDLIVMSSGGKSRLSSLFLGSTTSDLIRLEKSIPLLILKERIDKVHAWDILTNL